jgi:hypothetical protein
LLKTLKQFWIPQDLSSQEFVSQFCWRPLVFATALADEPSLLHQVCVAIGRN